MLCLLCCGGVCYVAWYLILWILFFNVHTFLLFVLPYFLLVMFVFFVAILFGIPLYFMWYNTIIIQQKFKMTSYNKSNIGAIQKMSIQELMASNKLDKNNLESMKCKISRSQIALNEKDYTELKSLLRMQEVVTRDALDTMLEYEQIENRPYYYKIHAPMILAFIDGFKTLINISNIAIKEIHNTKASELPRKTKKNTLITEMIEVQYNLIQCYNDLLGELYYVLDLKKLEIDIE